MNNFEDFRKGKINNILSSAKLATLLFCTVVAYNEIFTFNKITTNATSGNVSMAPASVLIIFTIIGIYLLWTFFSNKILQFKYIKVAQITESLIFISIFSSIIIISNSYASQHKFLFLLVIIISTIQIDMKYGIFISILSSSIVLIIDLIYAPKAGINSYFQNDLVLVGVFIVTAWVLGYYVEIENENLRRKNSQLKRLSKELVKQGKQREYFEDIILKNETCYNLLIENSHDAILIHRNGNLIFANESAVNLLGVQKGKQLNGMSILHFTPIDEINYIKEKFDLVHNKKLTKLFFEEKVIRDTGDIVSVQNTSTYFVYEGQPTILSILRDITSEKQVEKLQKDVEKNIELLNESRELNKLTTEFFSNISHELKTPLNVIYTAVQVLNLGGDNDSKTIKKNDEYLKIIKQNCYRLLKLINNLLDMTRLDSGFLKLQLQNCDIVSIVEEITLSVVPFVKSRKINIIFDTNVEEKIMAFDPDKIERIILNLISNAIKFTNPGGDIYVNITDINKNILISVRDTGVGIPEDKLKVIFERFAQVDKTFRRNREGSGIGLSLVKSLVELHSGEISVKSELEIGSTFIVKLPVKHMDEDYILNNAKPEANIDRVNIEFSDIYMNIE